MPNAGQTIEISRFYLRNIYMERICLALDKKRKDLSTRLTFNQYDSD
jgi:hypothetical protein